VNTAQKPDPTESVRDQLRPLFDRIVIEELDGVLESAEAI
jgi:hypothetical protein